MAELSALNIKITGDASGIKAAANSAQTALGGVQAAAGKASAASNSLGFSFARSGRAADGNGGNMKNLSMQLSQVAQQGQVTGQWAHAFGVQMADVGAAFGPLGAAIGVVAMIGLPMLANAMAGGALIAEELVKTTDDLAEAVGRATSAQQAAATPVAELAAQYGNLSGRMKEALGAQAAAEYANAMAALNAMAIQTSTAFGELGNQMSSARTGGAMTDLQRTMQTLQDDLGITAEQADLVSQAMIRLQNAQGPVAIADATAALRDRLLEAGVAADHDLVLALSNATAEALKLAASAPSAGWMDAAVGETNRLIGALKVAYAQKQSLDNAVASGKNAGLAAQYAQYGAGRTIGENLARESGALYGGNSVLPTSKGGGGGGGGGGGASELESLRKQLMSQEELQLAAFARQQEALTSAMDQKLVTTQEYNAMLEESQKRHSDKMAAIDVYRYGDGLQKTGRFFGDMARAFSSGNEEMVDIGRKFAAVEALTNAWRAFSQTLADPSIPFWGKFAAGAAVLSAGMGAVNAIKSGSSASSGAGSTAAASAVPAQAQQAPAQTVNVTVQDMFSESLMRALAAQLNAAGVNGVRLNVRAA